MSASSGSDGLFGAFRTQLRVIGALTLREMSSRFGKENLGYLWLFGEPALLGGAIGVLHVITGHEMPGGLDPAFEPTLVRLARMGDCAKQIKQNARRVRRPTPDAFSQPDHPPHA